ncbi:MAG: O-antigen ligase family protein [Planctomycetota bacterium]
MAIEADFNARYAVPRRGFWARERLSTGAAAEALLLRSVDAGLVAAIFLVPLIMGGRVALGQLVLVALSLWIALCWCLKQGLASQAEWVCSPAGPLLLAALALVGLQLAPLPPSILSMLSPRVYETLPLWAPGADSSSTLGVWTTLSLTPATTRTAFILLLAFMLLFGVTVQRVQRVEDVERLIRWIAISTVAMAAFALVHHFTNNGRFFWFFEHPYSSPADNVKGSFTNRNHFTQFVALGVGPLIWWLQDAVRSNLRERPACRFRFSENSSRMGIMVGLRAIALAVAVFAGLLSLSRGGAMVILAAVLISVLVLYRGSLIRRTTVLAVLIIGLLVGACLYVYGYESVAARLDDFGSLEELDKGQMRRSVWQANSRGIAQYPLSGTGLGSHREVCPMYLPSKGRFEGFEVTHAENGYLQVGLEAGVPGLLLVFIAIGLCAYWCIACLRRPLSTKVLLCFAAIAPSLAGSFLHSMVDFIWYVPGCMVAVIILAACACRLWQLTGRRSRGSAGLLRIPRAGWLIAAACLMITGYPMVQNRLAAARAEPCWYRYLLESWKSGGIYQTGRLETLQSMEKELSRVVDCQPDHARAHSRLAAVHVRLFDYPQDSTVNPIDVRQVREAVLASHFESAEAMEQWLSQAFGRRSRHLHQALGHARRAVTLCPLQGESYLYLATLSFLAGPESPGKAACTSQALKVRPFDGSVLFVAGQEAVLAGDLDQAIAYWKASCQAGRVHQNNLLDRLAGQVEVAFLLETFQPDRTALSRLASLYHRRNCPDELRLVRQCYAEACETEARDRQGETAARSWMEAAKTHADLENQPERLRCLRRAVACDRSDYDARFMLGACLFDTKHSDEAKKHLTWCLRQKPEDKNVRVLVEALIDRRLRMTSRPTTNSATGPRDGL